MRVCSKCRERRPRGDGDRRIVWCEHCYREWELRRFAPESQAKLNERFDSKILVIDECWIWTGATSSKGYASIGVEGKTCHAHRIAYERYTGEIPIGFDTDHSCRNHACVNPDHLEAVPRKVNLQRGLSGSLKTHCAQGHPWTEEHIYVRPGNGKKMCGTCSRERSRARALKRSAAG